MKRFIKCRRYVRYVKRSLVIYVTVSTLMFISLYSQRNIDDDRPMRGIGQLEAPSVVNYTDALDLNTNDHVATDANQNEAINMTSLDETEYCEFSSSFEANMNKLKSLDFSSSNVWMDKLGFNQLPANRTTSLPVLVTGASDRFYGGLQGLIKSVHEKLLPNYPNLKLIVYDMGFTEKQLKQLRKYCRCIVRRFPFEDLPSHVTTLGNFAFKPIILNYIFQEFGHAWWVDSSVRFTSNNLERALNYLEENGALFFTYGPVLNVALHTHRDTFQYFLEDPCPYMKFGEIEAGNVAFINNEVGRLILNRWVSCALDSLCLSPPGARVSCMRGKVIMNESLIGSCHRYDQSVLSVILRRLYHKQNDYPDVKRPIRLIEVKRGQKVSYFPSN